MTKSESEPPVPAAPEQTSDAGEEQPAPSANDRLKDAASFIREHPGLTIAGAITAGLLDGALIQKRRHDRGCARPKRMGARGTDRLGNSRARHGHGRTAGTPCGDRCRTGRKVCWHFRKGCDQGEQENRSQGRRTKVTDAPLTHTMHTCSSRLQFALAQR